MNTDSEQAIPLGGSAIWADDSAHNRVGRRLAPGAWTILLAALVTLLAFVGTVWSFVESVKNMHALGNEVMGATSAAAHETVARLISRAGLYSIQTSLISVVGALGVFSICILSNRLWTRRFQTESSRVGGRFTDKIQRLQLQVSDLTVVRDDALRTRDDVQKRFHDLTLSHTKLQNELNRRKEAEKSLAQQTQQLERSKDVLELHVQARTQEYQKLQRRNELILYSAGEGICGFDLQGRVTFANPTAARLTGWKVEEMVGRSEEEVFFPLKTRSTKDLYFRRDEKGEYYPEQNLQRRDGIRFAVEYVRTPIREGEKTVGAVVMFKDITERKLAEETLAHKAAELARSNAELEQFAYVASHDLQEPLRKIQAFGDRLKLKCDAVQLQDGRDYLDRMQNASARMQTLINDLLTFSRVISSSQPFVPVDLAAVTKEVLNDLEHRIERTKAEIKLGTLPTIGADPLQMRQLLQNLISNALKFQPADAKPVVKVEGRILTRDQVKEEGIFPNLPPKAGQEDKFCILSVEDNGIGFEEQYLEKIFAVFQRLHGRSEYEGTGVGLAVCRRITDRHGGLITARSTLGTGATFSVLLPQNQAKAEAAK